METYDVVVIGAGGAGRMCALQAGRRGKDRVIRESAAADGEVEGRATFARPGDRQWRAGESCRPRFHS